VYQYVAWGITDIENTNTYTVFFAIKQRVPDTVIDVLMIDDGQTLEKFYDVLYYYFFCTLLDPSMIGGCVAVYPDVIHLLCRWHVDR